MRKKIDWDETFKKYAEQAFSDAVFCRQENIPTTTFYKQKKIRGITRQYNSKKKKATSKMKPELVELSIDHKDLQHSKILTPTIRLSNSQGVTIEVYL